MCRHPNYADWTVEPCSDLLVVQVTIATIQMVCVWPWYKYNNALWGVPIEDNKVEVKDASAQQEKWNIPPPESILGI